MCVGQGGRPTGCVVGKHPSAWISIHGCHGEKVTATQLSTHRAPLCVVRDEFPSPSLLQRLKSDILLAESSTDSFTATEHSLKILISCQHLTMPPKHLNF